MRANNASNPKVEFDYVFNKARSLLVLRGLGEIRRPLETFVNLLPSFPNPPGLPDLREVKRKMDELTRTVDSSLHEVIVVTCVTALEVYLEAVYEAVYTNGTGRQWSGPKLENKQALLQWANKMKTAGVIVNPFLTVPDADMQHIFQIRHVVIHRGGVIDQRAIDCGLAFSGQNPDDKIEKFLDLDRTKQCLGQIESLIRGIESQVYPPNSSGALNADRDLGEASRQ